ncbi:MAG: 23S rRNA (adenine(2503)-C(2))-methyltransferase RlmN [Deltaproteobacteria bacterium]|nr:23S rRNA (adenine(2503)-C(2))-methyltransferase RlmN [Deltaproteobacteria bacterium]
MKSFVPDDVALASFPAPERIALHPLSLHHRLDSEVDGATKLLFRTQAGLLTESVVLRIATGRSTLCVSSQVGCAAACSFCATGKMGLARNLSAAEILDQVSTAGQILATEQRRLRNVVFMGMGEPFHNEEALWPALTALVDPAWFQLSPHKIMVSTVGVIEGMLRFGERFPQMGLALSLHSARQEVRERLIPLAKKYPLSALRRAIVELNRMQDRPVMLEYLMLEGLTDAEDDLAALVEWTERLEVHINLIPYNPIEGAPGLTGTPLVACTAFAARLKATGRTATVRRSLGGDIEAACGQLVRRENLALVRARP